MKIKVLSSREAKQYSAMEGIETTAVISIYSRGDFPLRYLKNEKIIAIRSWQFEDVQTNDLGMSLKQAEEIVAFVKQLPPVDVLIVQCDAGISRSAGVGAAISYWLLGNDDDIFNSPLYGPSPRCYRLVLKAIGIDLPEEIIRSKFERNRQAFAKAYPKDVI